MPAREALNAADVPKAVRIALLARVVAVRDRPPPSFPTGSPIWSVMSRDPQKGKVDMSGIFEVRDKHGPLLYRLFCVLDSEAGEHGVDARRSCCFRWGSRGSEQRCRKLSTGRSVGRPIATSPPARG